MTSSPKKPDDRGSLLLLLFLPVFCVWQGFVFSKIWLWFVAALGAPPVRIAQSVGLILLVDLVRYKATKRPANVSIDEGLRYAWMGVAYPTFVLLMAWIATKF